MILHCSQQTNQQTEADCFGKNGAVTIIRDDGYSRPFLGSCAFPEKEGVDAAFEEYFRISEQLPTRLATVVERDEKGMCTFAGLAVLQPLPFAEESVLEKVSAVDLQQLLQTIEEQGVEGCAKTHFQTDEKVWELRTAQYKCNCSRDYLLGVLASLGEAQMRQIIAEDNGLKVHCHYCNTDYVFYDEDADKLFGKK